MNQLKKKQTMFTDEWYTSNVLLFDKTKSTAKKVIEVIRFPKHKGFSGSGIRV